MHVAQVSLRDNSVKGVGLSLTPRMALLCDSISLGTKWGVKVL